MASVDMLKTRQLLKKGVVGQRGDNLSVLVTMKYKGKGVVTSVIVTNATDITMITTEGTYAYDWATYTTLGALVDAINSDGVFVAKILDALSTTPTGAGLAIGGTLAVDSNGQYNVMSNTSNADFIAYRLTYDRTFGKNQKLRNSHRVSIAEIITDLTLGAIDANSFKIYEGTHRNGDENLLYQKTPTSGTISTTNWASGQAEITGGEGKDLIVMITDTVSITGTVTVVGTTE